MFPIFKKLFLDSKYSWFLSGLVWGIYMFAIMGLVQKAIKGETYFQFPQFWKPLLSWMFCGVAMMLVWKLGRKYLFKKK